MFYKLCNITMWGMQGLMYTLCFILGVCVLPTLGLLPIGPPFFTVNKAHYSTTDGSLKVVNQGQSSGMDKLGAHKVNYAHMVAGETRITTYTKAYSDLSIVIYEQHFPDAITGASVGDPQKTNTGFPCFKIQASENTGFLSYQGSMFGSSFKTGTWKNTDALGSGVPAGPLVLFDKQNHTTIISTFNEFMISSPWRDEKNSLLCYGIMGSVDTIPAGFIQKTIVYTGNNGINDAMSEWGRIMRFYYDKSTAYRESDLTLNYLGFWTDGGAYYFYNTEPGMDYQDTILKVKEYSLSVGLPYKYVQYDSWWYYKDTTPKKMVTLWEPMPDVFPDGLKYMWNKTNWQASCHNRQWSALTKYAKANGGQYNFVVEKGIALPQDPVFWKDLFVNATKWGLITYEQDHLNEQFDEASVTKTDIHAARNWLLQMGEGARQRGVTIQYCMSYPRHDLQSLEIPVVTHARVSHDYRPGKNLWKIGITSIFAESLGIAPFKDNFFTSSHYEPGNPYHMTETQPDLNVAIATMSTAPVAPSDKVGYTNVSLLMRCCNADGLILKPSKPLMAIDAQIMQMAFKDGSGPNGEVWTTYSEVGGHRFGIVLAADLSGRYDITPAAAHFQDPKFGSSMYVYRLDSPSVPLQPFGQSKALTLQNCGRTDFCLYYTTPALMFRGDELVIIGELAKWVPISPQRIQNIQINDEQVQIDLHGYQGEEVHFWLVYNHVWVEYLCTISHNGDAVLLVTTGGDCKIQQSVTKNNRNGNHHTMRQNDIHRRHRHRQSRNGKL